MSQHSARNRRGLAGRSVDAVLRHHGGIQFESEASPAGAMFLGTPDEVVDKILAQHRMLGHERFLLQLTVGPMPHDAVLRAIELLGTKVAPAVRAALGTNGSGR